MRLKVIVRVLNAGRHNEDTLLEFAGGWFVLGEMWKWSIVSISTYLQENGLLVLSWFRSLVTDETLDDMVVDKLDGDADSSVSKS